MATTKSSNDQIPTPPTTTVQLSSPHDTQKSQPTSIYVASAAAGMIARVPLHPIDTCKAKLQVVVNLKTQRKQPPPSPLSLSSPSIPVSNQSFSNMKNPNIPSPSTATVYRHVLHCVSHTFQKEGLRGLYPGW